jgi:hypothetical protein
LSIFALQTFVRLQPQQASTVPGSETEFCISAANRRNREAEHQRNPLRYFGAAIIAVFVRRMVMPVLLVPALFIGGTAVVLGGGYFLLHGLHVIAW